MAVGVHIWYHQHIPSTYPIPKMHQVLVRVTHAGVNGGCETFRVRGEHLFAGNTTLDHYLLGAEGCGTIVAVGGAPFPPSSSPPLALHTPVSFGGGGAFGEYAIVPAARCFCLPHGLPPSPHAVALALSGTVANTALQAVAGVRAGETVLVTAAAGGTGHLAVQVAQRVGARVVATCGGEGKAARLRALGVHRVIDYTKEVSLCFLGGRGVGDCCVRLAEFQATHTPIGCHCPPPQYPTLLSNPSTYPFSLP